MKQHPTLESIGTVPNKEEIKSTIKKMKSDKAPGLTGLTTNVLKNLPEDALGFIV
jgi:hypothetical protein